MNIKQLNLNEIARVSGARKKPGKQGAKSALTAGESTAGKHALKALTTFIPLIFAYLSHRRVITKTGTDYSRVGSTDNFLASISVPASTFGESVTYVESDKGSSLLSGISAFVFGAAFVYNYIL